MPIHQGCVSVILTHCCEEQSNTEKIRSVHASVSSGLTAVLEYVKLEKAKKDKEGEWEMDTRRGQWREGMEEMLESWRMWI